MAIFGGLVKQDSKNERAWLWLSAFVDEKEKKQHCLKKELEISPDNPEAKQALSRLEIEQLTVDEILSPTGELIKTKPTK